MMIPLLCLTVSVPASAADPTAELHLLGTMSTSGQDARSGLATGGAAGLSLVGPLDVELSFDAGVSAAQALFISATPQLRLWLTPRQGRAGALSLTAGAGLWVSPSAGATVAPGLAWDLPGPGTWVPRLQTRYLVDPGDGRGALTLSVGVAGPHRRQADEPAPAPEPVSQVPGRVPYRWVPHPVNSCILEGQVQQAVAGPGGAAPTGQTPGDDGAETTAEGGDESRPSTPTSTAAGPLTGQQQPLDIDAMLHPKVGGLVIVVAPGDQVAVAGHALPIGRDDTVVLASDTGVHVVDITGAGRVRTVKPSISEGHVTWVRAPSWDEPHLVHFEQGESVLDEDERARVEAIARRAGGWRFRLTGEYSPEGDVTTNRRLATERAARTRAALIAAGLPEDRIEMAPPEAGDPDARIEDQRVCRIDPLPPAEDHR